MRTYTNIINDMKKTLLTLISVMSLGLIAEAGEQTVKLTTSKVGTPITLLVNASRAGVSVDWGTGTPQQYTTAENGIITVTGTPTTGDVTLTSTKGLTTLIAEDCGLTAIDLSDASELLSLYLPHNELTSIDLEPVSALTDLNLADNKITGLSTLVSTKLPYLQTIDISNNELTATSFSYNTENLTYLNISGNNYRTLTINKATALDALKAHNNQLANINVSYHQKLSLLAANDNTLSRYTIPDTLECLQQVALDRTGVKDVDFSQNINLTTLTISGCGATNVQLPTKKSLQVYDCSNNALSFSAFPRKNRQPTVYFAYDNQADLDISGMTGFNKGSWGSDYLPWVKMNPAYSSRGQAEYQLDFSDFTSGSAASSVVFAFYSVNDAGEATVLEKAAAAQPNKDYSWVSGKATFLHEYKKVYAEMTDAGYPELTIHSTCFAVIDPTAEGIETVTDTPLTGKTYDLQGRQVEKLQRGIYIHNGQKILKK